ncbi:MAG TPA: 2-C-methyl-D-erythritol 4-phosphate cytidylyltransferase, partial [Methyloceanibacter sp.]|nr:2-C-methyl-D-erythritol 4-phosphate cytidylyltransferase [Methyloceanibacter sp.]
MSVVALIVAAGRGLRASGPKPMIPKQYFPVGGVPILTRAVAAFAGHPEVDDVIVVIHPEDAGLYETASQIFSSRLRSPIAGGAHRQDSVRAGLEALAA